MSNFFQSDSWWKVQKQLDEKTLSGAGDGWHYNGRVLKDAVGPYFYIPYGPVVKDEKTLDEAIAHAKKQAAKEGAYRMIVEPSLPITPEQAAKRFKTKRTGLQPSRTLVIDLEQSEEDIIKAMAKTRRNEHRNAAKKGITFHESKERAEFDIFLKFLRDSGEAKQFDVKDGGYFEALYEDLVKEDIARLFVGQINGETEVICFVIDDEDTRYYLYVGRDLSKKGFQVSAPMISHIILEAKERGLKKFDLYGISASDDVEDDMTGFTKFKRTFGGETVQYAGSWEIPVKPLKYQMRRLIDFADRFRSPKS